MNYFTFAWVIAASCFGIFSLTHLLWCRSHSKKDSFPLLNRLFRFFLPTVFILAYFGFDKLQDFGIAFSEPTYSAAILHTVVTSFIFLFACLAFYAAVDHSVRIRLFIELYEANGAAIGFKEILKRYNPHVATENRLEKMLVAGYIAKDDRGNYLLTNRGKYCAKLVIKGKNLFKIGIGGGLD